MVGTLGWEELLLILAIVGLIAGGSRVADLGGSLGRGVREFRRGLQNEPGDPADGEDAEASEPTSGGDADDSTEGPRAAGAAAAQQPADES